MNAEIGESDLLLESVEGPSISGWKDLCTPGRLGLLGVLGLLALQSTAGPSAQPRAPASDRHRCGPVVSTVKLGSRAAAWEVRNSVSTIVPGTPQYRANISIELRSFNKRQRQAPFDVYTTRRRTQYFNASSTVVQNQGETLSWPTQL